MFLKNLDVNNLSKLCLQHVDHVTCIECCKYYVVPTTATCGHSLCHSCWRARRTCPLCGLQVEKKNLKLNLPLQSLKDHVQVLASAFENLFTIKLDEFPLQNVVDKESEDSNKNVKEWLASSQNNFSAPVTESQQSIQDQFISSEQITSNIQIHSEKKKSSKSLEVIHRPPLQVDWDKIEELPEVDSESKKEQNPIGPMDIEPFDLIDAENEYSMENLRRSSRNKENKNDNSNKVLTELSSDKNSERGLNGNSSNKSHKLGKNWNNVKRMKKEFSKLNKKNRNKLNVSIEMCKKTQSNANKAVEPNLQMINDSGDKILEASANIEVTGASNCNNDGVTDKVDTNVNEKTDEVLMYQNTIQNDVPVVQNNVNMKSVHVEDKQLDLEIYKENINSKNAPKVCFFKKSSLNKGDISEVNKKLMEIESNDNFKTNCVVNNDDIEITIKIGNTLTNICIKKKDNDVQLKINSDREIQTNLENCITQCEKPTSSSVTQNKSQRIDINNMHEDKLNEDAIIQSATPKICLEKSTSTKKNTASADTATCNFEITESIERQLSNIIDNAQLINDQKKTISINNSGSNKESQTKQNNPVTLKAPELVTEDMECLNDLDIFDSESVKEANVQSLKATKKTPSAILMPSIKSNKLKSLKDKRDRELTESGDLPSNKKMKLTHCSASDNIKADLNKEKHVSEQDSENMNYDAIMSQVFANIDADMKDSTKINKNVDAFYNNSKDLSIIEGSSSNKNDHKQYENQKFSENIFSILEKDSGVMELSKSKITKQCEDNSVRTAKINMENIDMENKISSQTNDIEIMEIGTPLHEDDSDKSIVEETPQKTSSFAKNRNELTIISNTQQLLSKNASKTIKQLQEPQNNVDKDTDNAINVLSLSDTLGESTKTSKNITIVEAVQPRPTLETPLTITKFVDHIKHKSTPMARKSLNFNRQNCEEDPERTLCPSSLVAAKTTQEKEFMHKAFEQSQTSPVQSLYNRKNHQQSGKFCIGGSCLSSAEQTNLKLLCLQQNWTYVDKYSKELTHLVVGVDEENKSQRSVKYMCALAAGKWIISYKWVEKCLKAKEIVDEEPFEALDGTGEPGPRRSRLAKRKLFEGITFHCMPPFSVLDVDTLKDILASAGGRVAAAAGGARAGPRPALLLAEPERTQDDKFLYLAMEFNIVPVNYEWVLNCLGSYTLGSIFELLLCPSSLLPPVTATWPQELMSRDYE